MRIRTPLRTPRYAQPQYTQPQYVAPAPEKKKKKTALIIILAISAVLGIVIVAVLVFGGGDDGCDAEYVAKWYTQAIFDFDYDEAKMYSFIKIAEYFEFEEGVDPDELKETFKNAKENAYLELEGDIEAVTKVTLLLEVKGDDGEDSNTLDLYVVESNSQWYAFNGLDFILDFLFY